MKIAQLSTHFISIPPKGYGAIESTAHLITEELVKRGHEVSLLATGDSTTKANLVSIYKKEIRPVAMHKLLSPLADKIYWMHSLPSLLHVSLLLDKALEFDIIHNHFHYLPLFFSTFIKTPMVHTYHGDFSLAKESPIEMMILEKYKDSYWVAISESQKRNSPLPLNFVSVVRHGIEVEKYTFGEASNDYFAWLGRITQRKGIKEAIEACKRLHKKLIIAGIVNKRDEPFFKEEIEPLIDGETIIYIGEIGGKEKVEFLKKAKALLFPIQWEEPFGLVMIEAMACGAPVIAYNRGSVSEIVRDGLTGFIIDPDENERLGKRTWIIKKTGIEGLVEAVERIGEIDRKACRAHVEENFTVEKMVGGYEEVYSKILGER